MKRPVIVTTKHRGVFFGYAENTDGEAIKLEDARCCIYWSVDIKGFAGLAKTGPSEFCKVGPPVTMTLRDITAVLEVTSDAVAAWEREPWGR